MVYKLFLDTDVLIDFFTNRTPFANATAEIFELQEQGAVQLFVSAVSINNIYYIVRRFIGHKKTVALIESILEMTEIIGTTKSEIVHALQHEFSDYEDAVQYACATTVHDMHAIITRNIKDYKKAAIAVMTPMGFLEGVGLV